MFFVHTAAATLLAVAAFPVVLFAGRKIWQPRVLGRAVALALVGALVAVHVAVGRARDVSRPGVFASAGNSAWVRCQRWARHHTARDALFTTPPHLWWLYVPVWRVHPHRSTVVTLSELLKVAFAPGYAPIWQKRFDALLPGARSAFAGDYFANARRSAEAYRPLPTASLLDAAHRYGASFAVIEQPSPHRLPVAWENEGFVVHRLSGLATTPAAE